MPGPIQARQCLAAGFFCRMQASVSSRTPAAKPFQPAWATPNTVAWSSDNTTDKQSAVNTASTLSGCVVTDASASGGN